MLSIAPPYLEHALDLPLDFPLDTPLDVATFNDILARIKAMNPLVATDSRLINPANAGRPIPQGAALDFDGLTHYAELATTITADGVTLEGYIKPSAIATATAFGLFKSSSFQHFITLGIKSDGVFIVRSRGTGFDINHTGGTYTSNQWYFIKAYFSENLRTLEVDGSEVINETGFIDYSSIVIDKYAVARNSDSSPSDYFDGAILAPKINDVHFWDLRDNGLSALTGGSDLTLVNDPPSVTMVTPVDPANERGFTNSDGTIYLALADNPATDVLGGPTQWPGSVYPVLPNITGGTAEALTAFNTNVAIGGVQPPAIANAGIPATWVQLDGSVPLLQVKDNGDSTSSLALGLPIAPTTEEQETIDKYHE